MYFAPKTVVVRAGEKRKNQPTNKKHLSHKFKGYHFVWLHSFLLLFGFPFLHVLPPMGFISLR